MNYVIINLSPRGSGTSGMLSRYIQQRIQTPETPVRIFELYRYLTRWGQLMEEINKADCLILVGPCYVNSFPADTITLLSEMSNHEGVLHGQVLYGVIQGGMPYIDTHEHGLKLLDNFAAVHDIRFQGGFVLGGGAVLNGEELQKVIGAKKVIPAFHRFIENIKAQRTSEADLYCNAETKIPSIMSGILAALMNRKLGRELKMRGITYRRDRK